MRKFLDAVTEILEIQKPYKIVYRFLKKDRAAEYIAYYRKGVVCEHVIRINQGIRGRSIKTLIAHEFVHAWQAENYKEDTHGDSFQEMASYLSVTLALDYGFKLKGLIYNSEIDV